MNTLIVEHVDQSDPAQFLVVRLADGKSLGPVSVPSPVGFPVEGRPHSDLMQELRWYLETFLEYPFPPETDHAQRVQDALKAWGQQAFDALFGDRATGRLFDAATAEQYAQLQLRISSDDPRILHWPWEALRDPEVGVLARTCQVERRLNKVRDPHPISAELPRDAVNILLVTARPYERDVSYRSISRPLVDQIERLNLPATVTVLRPPTFDNLRAHLRERSSHYHILHFDGHGAYGSTFKLQRPQGRLIFEDDQGRPDAKPAETLSQLLREYSVPVVVLNACQSAMVDEHAEDAFASVAAGMLRSGVRSVLAMAYSVYVSGAQRFLPAFYLRLFETGSVADATRAGRQQMISSPKRICARGEYPLDDWLVPVLYEQDVFDVSFASQATPKEVSKGPALPAEARDTQNPYGFIGRDGPLLQLERALRRPPAGILIHGLGGVGKTTLARGFIQWLATTDGLGQGCFWFTFQGIRSAEFVFNEMVGALFGTNALAAGIDEKIAALIQTFQEHRFLIVWDNFEVVCGVPGTLLQPTLSAEDRQRLLKFLSGLRGGQSKVLITSRVEEDWLDAATCYKLSIGGMQGEERWEYCDVILQDLGFNVPRDNPDWVKLMDLLEGHPLAMRVVLPRLQKSTPAELIGLIESNLAEFASQDQESAKLFATLGFVQDGLPQDLQPLLIPLALHERFVLAELLEAMAQRLGDAFTGEQVDRLMSALRVAGLLRDQGNRIHEMHPVLSRFLRLSVFDQAPQDGRDVWCRQFVDVMGSLADHYTPLPLHEQRGAFHILAANFRSALAEAERLGMDQDIAALTQSLAAYALHERNFLGAADLYARLAEHDKSRGDEEGQAAVYHQLGRISREQRDFAAAEQWCRKSLAIKEKQGNEHGVAISYHLLGRIADEQRDFAAAEQWYRKSLAIEEKQGNEHGAALSYHQLGIIAEEQCDLAAAEQWYRKSLAIFEKQGNEHEAAISYHQLGIIAQKQRDFAAAEQWYRKSLAIEEKQGNEHEAAGSYHQLGTIAEEQRDLAAAEQWYRKALAIDEKQGNEHGAAISYHQLGRVAQEQSDFAAAEQWYRKSLAIDEKQSDEHGAAISYAMLGRLAEFQAQYEQAGQWYIKAHQVLRRSDPHNAEVSARNFRVVYQQAEDSTRQRLKAKWEAAGLGELPEQK